MQFLLNYPWKKIRPACYLVHAETICLLSVKLLSSVRCMSRSMLLRWCHQISQQIEWAGREGLVARVFAVYSIACSINTAEKEEKWILELYFCYSARPHHGITRVARDLTKNDGEGNVKRRSTKGLPNKTMALHVRYTFWYTSLPSSAKQQREMT